VTLALSVELPIKEKGFVSRGLFALVIDVSSSCALKAGFNKATA